MNCLSLGHLWLELVTILACQTGTLPFFGFFILEVCQHQVNSSEIMIYCASEWTFTDGEVWFYLLLTSLYITFNAPSIPLPVSPPAKWVQHISQHEMEIDPVFWFKLKQKCFWLFLTAGILACPAFASCCVSFLVLTFQYCTDRLIHPLYFYIRPLGLHHIICQSQQSFTGV